MEFTSKKFITSLQSIKSMPLVNPLRDWIVLLVLFCIAFGSIVVWNVWTFETVTSGGVLDSSKVIESQKADLSSLETARAFFKSRAAEEANYGAGTYPYLDPSQ